MTFCTNCGQPLTGLAFCTNCGQAVTAGAVPPPTAGRSAGRPQGAPGPLPLPVIPASTVSGPSRRRSRRLAVILVVALVAVIGGAGVLFFVLRKSNHPDSADRNVPAVLSSASGSAGNSPSARPSTAAQTGLAPSSVAQGSVASSRVVPVIPVETVTIGQSGTPLSDPSLTTVTATVQASTARQSTSPTSALAKTTSSHSVAPKTTVAAAANPLNGPAKPLSCGSGYIVQLASETTAAVLRARIPSLIAAHLLPGGSSWTNIAGSCRIWQATTGAVLYAGPFQAAYDACDARLHGPSDAFIKIVDPDNFKTFYSCLCPTESSTLPVLQTVGQTTVWVGELQRAMEKLGYDIPGLQGEAGVPVAWGQFTADTSTAIKKFQTSSGLPATGKVDATTWDSLKAGVC